MTLPSIDEVLQKNKKAASQTIKKPVSKSKGLPSIDEVLAKSKKEEPAAAKKQTTTPKPVREPDRYTGSNPVLQKAQSILDVINRLGQKTADTLLMTDRTKLGGQYTPVATPMQEKVTDIGGLILGSAVPYGGIYKGLGAIEATSKAAQKLTPLARTGIKGGIAGGTYETTYGAMQGESPKEIAKRAAIGTTLGAAGDVAITKVPQIIRAAREANQLNAVKKLDLRPAPKPQPALPAGTQLQALPPARTGLLPEWVSDPAGVVRARGRVGQPVALPMTPAETAARKAVRRATGTPLLPGQVGPIEQKAMPKRELLTGTKPKPIEERTFEEAGQRSVKAYQYEYPELKPYIRTEAGRLLEELKDTIKGQRTYTETDNGTYIFGGNKRYTSEPIERIRDELGASYMEIGNALARLVEDKGLENNALSKRIELIIDDNLTNGVKDITGFELPPSQEYIALKQKIDWNKGQYPQITKPPAKPTEGELTAARNILRTIKNVDRAQAILNAFPELKPQFKGWVNRIERAQAARAKAKPNLTPKPEAPAPAPELQNARNILKSIKNPDRAKSIFKAYPELKKEFPKLVKQLEKPAAKPKTQAEPKQAKSSVKKTEPTKKQEPPKPPKKESLRDIETKAGAAIDESVGDVKPAVGMQVKIVGKKPDAPANKQSPHKFSDPAIESRWNAANGIPKESLIKRTKAAIKSIIDKATREFEYLPRTGEFSEARFVLSNMQKQKDITSDRTLRLQQYILLDQNKIDHDLFRRKVILDDLINTEGELPFGFTQESLKSELARVDEAVKNNPKVAEAVAKRKEVWAAIKDEYVDALGDIGFDVSERFNRKDYYRHQILEYVNSKERRGFMKQRLGSSKDINTNYLQAEYEVMAQMLHDIELAKGLKRIGDKYNIRSKLEKSLQPGEKLADKIPPGYVKWQPRQGGLFHLADSIPFRVADKMYRAAMEELGLSDRELKRAMVKSGHFDYWVVKEELAKTLDGMVKKRDTGPLAEVSREALLKWKKWTLLNPRRWFKYNVRNISGDADAAFAGNPSTFKKLPQATKELYRVYAGDGAMTVNMRDWFERGGMQTLLQAQELGDINHLKMFVNLMEKKGGLMELPTRTWQGYWKSARMSTDFREALLRYAAYLDYLGQMKANSGRPRNFGASIPEEVMALDDIKDRAFKLSNELLGAYDQVSVIGQGLREHLIPFWSWNEVNFRRYKQLIINAANDGKLSHTLGRKFITVIPKSPLIAYRIGKLAAKATALWVILDLWNNTRYPELEARLSREERERPHIILGKDDEGKTIYFGRLGALQDFVNWFGIDAGNVQDVRDILNGKKSVKEVALEMAKEPINKIAQGLSPFYKTTAELASGQKYFPDIFKPGQVRDKGLHAAQSLGLENEYKEVMRLPSKPYNKTLQDILVYTQDPGQTAYYDIIDAKYRFKEKQGKGGSGVFRSPKGDALYNYKLALKLKDKEAAKKYLQEYINLGGTGDGLKRSLESMHPLYGLSKADRIAFVRSLDDEEKAKLEEAVNYYKDILRSR